MTETIDAYPLAWPVGWKRTDRPQRSRFEPQSLHRARHGLTHELKLLGAADIVISSNIRLLRSGDVAARQNRMDDVGVAVYFTLNGQQRCIPVDKWDRVEDNLRAAELSIAALRGLDRWGAKEMVDAAFQGFQALPSGGTAGLSWWRSLEVEPTASEVEIESAYRRLVKVHHPDAGGNAERFAEITEAYQAAKRRKTA